MLFTAKAAVSWSIPTHPPGICGKIIDAIGHRSAELLDQKVVHPDFFRAPWRPIREAIVAEVTDQFFVVASTEIAGCFSAKGCRARRQFCQCPRACAISPSATSPQALRPESRRPRHFPQNQPRPPRRQSSSVFSIDICETYTRTKVEAIEVWDDREQTRSFLHRQVRRGTVRLLLLAWGSRQHRLRSW
jgi:hypothetical protein